jgi:hypothetical protein
VGDVDGVANLDVVREGDVLDFNTLHSALATGSAQ